MSTSFDDGVRRLLSTVEEMIDGKLDGRLRGIVAGGKVVASAIPLSSLRHAMQSQAHTDADHTTVPNNGDVWTFIGDDQVWGPRPAPTGGGTTVVIAEPIYFEGEPLTLAGDFLRLGE